jgi:thioredoxin 1
MASNNIVTLLDSNFDTEVLKSDVPVLVDFWAPWCAPCRAIAPAVEELASTYAGKVKVAKLNTDDHPATPQKYNIRGIPTLIVFKNGAAVDQVVGGVPKSKIEEMLKNAL